MMEGGSTLHTTPHTKTATGVLEWRCFFLVPFARRVGVSMNTERISSPCLLLHPLLSSTRTEIYNNSSFFYFDPGLPACVPAYVDRHTSVPRGVFTHHMMNFDMARQQLRLLSNHVLFFFIGGAGRTRLSVTGVKVCLLLTSHGKNNCRRRRHPQGQSRRGEDSVKGGWFGKE